jgi:phospholipid/cholesterol/gamma-HCH transport system substrate-binding protein
VLTGSGPEGSASLPRLAAQSEATLQGMQRTAERLKDSSEVVKNAATEFRRVSVRMSEPGGTLDRIARSTEAIAAASTTLNTSLLPKLDRSSEEATRAARQIGRVAEGLAEQPQSLLLGRGAPAPGPGEAGFVAPTEP